MGRFVDAFNRLKKEVSRVAKTENVSDLDLYLNAAFCFLRYGITPNEYLGWNCWRYSKRMLKSFYTARTSYKCERVFNEPQYAHFFDNKVDFNKKFSSFVKRDWIFTPEVENEDVSRFINSHPKVVIKPIGLSSGRGIYCIESSNWTGEIEIENALIEEFVTQHPLLEQLNPSSVNTIRVYTLAKKDGIPVVLSASIRVGGKGSEVDNYHAGGCGYPIDVSSGIIFMPGTDIKGGRHIFHPSTGIQMVGFKIPNWDELKQFVFKAMKVVPECRLIAWDVAVLANGFEMIEGNCNGDPGFMQAPSKQGMKSVILKEI